MRLSFRQKDILEIARREGKVTVEGLMARFQVTAQTIRRDLTELSDTGQLDRVHGGAILPSGVTNIGYDERRSLNAEAKAVIAQLCAAAIPEGASVFLNIGTTTESVAAQLLSHRNMLAFTNNLNVANILAANPDCEVVVMGGTLRRADGGLVGSQTMRAIEQYKFDYAVIGCSAVDEAGDLLDYDIQEVGVSQTIIAQARNLFVVADHSKFQRTAPARIGSLRQVDCCFTDRPLSKGLAQRCADWGTEVAVP